MKIRVSSNAADVSRWLRTIAREQLPQANANAINGAALAFQAAQRQHQRQAFTLRGRGATFFDRGVKLKPFASKASPVAIVRIEPPGGAPRAGVIVRHEEDAERRPERSKALTVPIAARPSKTSLVPRQLKPRQLALKPVGPGKGGVQLFRGKLGTFAFRRSDGTGAILQRRGNEVRALYVMVPRTDLDQRLDFEENALRVVPKVWPGEFVKAWDNALRTAR